MSLDNINIKSTRSTPEVSFSEGLLSIRGRSIPEAAAEFYKPLEQWVELYAAETDVDTRVVLSFDFINTASTKWIYAIIKKLARYRDVHKRLKVEWYYETGDDELFELGHIIQSFIDCPFIYYETEQS
jgi:hypothetical protein